MLPGKSKSPHSPRHLDSDWNDEPVAKNVLFWISGSGHTKVFVVCAAIFSNMFLYGLFLGLAPMYREELQLSELSTAWLFSAFSAVSVFVIPFLGLCVDEMPQRIFFTFSSIICSVSSLMMAIDDSTYWFVLLARIIHGFGVAVMWITGPAIVSDIFNIRSHTKSLGIVYIFSIAARFCGAVLGTNSFDWAGTTLPIYVSSSLMNICITALLLTSLPSDNVSVSVVWRLIRVSNLREGWLEYKALFSHATVLLLLFSAFLYSVGFVTFQVFVPIWVQSNLHTSVSGAADLYAIMAFTKVASQPFFGRWTERIGPNLIGGLGLIGFGLCLPFLPLVQSLGSVVFAFACIGVAMTATVLPSFIALSNYVEKIYDGTGDIRRRFTLANSLWLTTYMIGQTVAPVVTGAILDALEQNNEASESLLHSAILGSLAVVMVLFQGPAYIFFTRGEDQLILQGYEGLRKSDE